MPAKLVGFLCMFFSWPVQSEYPEEEMREVFRTFDRSKTGTISASEVRPFLFFLSSLSLSLFLLFLGQSQVLVRYGLFSFFGCLSSREQATLY